MGRSHTKLIRRQKERALKQGILPGHVDPFIAREKAGLRRAKYRYAKPGAVIRVRRGETIEKALKRLKNFNNATGKIGTYRPRRRPTI